MVKNFDLPSFVIFTIAALMLARDVLKRAVPTRPLDRPMNLIVFWNSLFATIEDILAWHDWVTFPAYAACLVLSAILWWRWRHKGRGKRAARAMGAKGKALIGKLVENMPRGSVPLPDPV